MTSSKEIDKNNIQELELLASIPIAAGNPILIIDKSGEIEWVNNAFELLHGYNLQELKQLPSNESTDFIKVLNETDKNFFKTNSSLSFSRTIENKDGQLLWIQSTLTPIKLNDNEVKRFIVIETDITQQKEVEEELVQRWENTQTLTEHLESVKDYIEEQIGELAEQKKALEIAKEKSEEVLNKVLPYEVAIQLKKKGYASPRHYKKVTILNINIRNFMSLTNDIPIEELVQQLHEVLVGFDNILEAHYVEKIKTIGGNYLGAGGVPLRNRSNPIDVILTALEIYVKIAEVNSHRKSKGQAEFELGMGIHTGKVIAGVVGKNKLTYDIWGDTVNVSSTIEHNVPSNGIFISEATFFEIERYFDTLSVKELVLGSAEEIKLYQVVKIKEQFAEDKAGMIPNKDFMQILSKL